MNTFLITGSNGFIGFHLIKALSTLHQNSTIIGVDNMNDYYDVNLKNYRLSYLENIPNFLFIKGDITDKIFIKNIFNTYKPNIVIHLAAQAGVRYSLINPYSYINNNINGFYNVIENCKNYNIEHLIYASSSSVYGNYNDTSKPESLYAVTKKTNELIGYSYSQNYDLKTTGLRFFSVYGPYGRPDMAYYSFTENLINNKEIIVYNNGLNKRDLTYIDDVINGILSSINTKEKYNIYDIGSGNPISTNEMINIILETMQNCNIIVDDNLIKYAERQKGDVVTTKAQNSIITPEVNFNTGYKLFIDWYLNYKSK
jgi:UDP-glucuronate 4-epimerase